MDSMKQEQNKSDTSSLMFRTLSNLGCQSTKNEDGTISVSYQGKNFHLEFGRMYARVLNPMWTGVKADEQDMPNQDIQPPKPRYFKAFKVVSVVIAAIASLLGLLYNILGVLINAFSNYS